MRTTLTLDSDVTAQLDAARTRTGAPFEDVVNEALRIGLRVMENPSPARAPYRTPSSSLGGCRLPDLDGIQAALTLTEGDDVR